MRRVPRENPRRAGHLQATVDAPVDAVWSAYTTPADIMAWNAASDDWHTTAARVDLRPGGEFSSRIEARDGSAGFDFAGTYTTVVEHELIEYELGDRSATVAFAETASGTSVTVTFDAEEEHPVAMQRDGWQAILDRFRRHVEGTA